LMIPNVSVSSQNGKSLVRLLIKFPVTVTVIVTFTTGSVDIADVYAPLMVYVPGITVFATFTVRELLWIGSFIPVPTPVTNVNPGLFPAAAVNVYLLWKSSAERPVAL